MSKPIDLVRCFHNAFRRDITQIDAGVLDAAKNGGDLSPWLNRLQIMCEVLDYHAQGEEAAVFPAVNNLATLVVQPYIFDHRELDVMVKDFEAIRKAPNALAAARATAVFQSHLKIHLAKEDSYIYPFLNARTTVEQQIAIGKVLSSKTPPQRFPTSIGWLLPLLDLTDQVVLTKGWMQLMPPEIFANVKPLIKQNANQNWSELTRQIPELSES